MANIRDTRKTLENMEAELIALREDIERLRGALQHAIVDVSDYEEELKRYKDAEKKKKLIILPVPLGSMTYQIIPDTRDKTKYTYTQHVFSIDDVSEYGNTVFLSDTEAMVAAHNKSI